MSTIEISVHPTTGVYSQVSTRVLTSFKSYIFQTLRPPAITVAVAPVQHTCLSSRAFPTHLTFPQLLNVPHSLMKQPAPIMPSAVSFVDIESQAGVTRSMSNVDLEKFNSAAPTLNNTPTSSRSPSPSRKANMEPLQSRSEEKISTATTYAMHELDIAWMGAVIIICFFTSGLIDAVAFNSWNCFVGMQTGAWGSLRMLRQRAKYLQATRSLQH